MAVLKNNQRVKLTESLTITVMRFRNPDDPQTAYKERVTFNKGDEFDIIVVGSGRSYCREVAIESFSWIDNECLE